jgi:hypothetical protein
MGERVPEHVRVQVMDACLLPAAPDSLVYPEVSHRSPALGKPVGRQVSVLVRFPDAFVSVKRPCRLVTKRNDAGTPSFAHHVGFAPFNAYVFGFQSCKLGAPDTRIEE